MLEIWANLAELGVPAARDADLMSICHTLASEHEPNHYTFQIVRLIVYLSMHIDFCRSKCSDCFSTTS